jgi:NAD(P)-dependent dehydrogenase (short-subunit alcohol dehydrogenase family)
MDFTDKVILITGASSGIGMGCAIYLAKLGAKLALVGRNQENLAKTVQQCVDVSQKDHVLSIVADVDLEADAARIVDSTVAHFGRLDVLVNNAGILRTGSIENTSLAQYDEVMGTNVRSVYHLTMLATPHLVKTKGNIVNVSSVAGTRSFPGLVAYCVSKAAVDQFTKCVALELAAKGVRVNAVNPGVIVTDIHKRGGMDEATYAQFLETCKVRLAKSRKRFVLISPSLSRPLTPLAVPATSLKWLRLSPSWPAIWRPSPPASCCPSTVAAMRCVPVEVPARFL